MIKLNKLYLVAAALVSVLAFTAVQAQQSKLAKNGQLTKLRATEPEAVELLHRMTDYLNSLKQFSVHTLNLREDMLVSGHRVDFEVANKLTVKRPNMLQGERKGHLTDQLFYYNGKSLTLYNPSDKVYATMAAPATIDATLDFARNTLNIGYPIADLLYVDSFPLLMQDVALAGVIGTEVISGVKCSHLIFSRPGVDFQVWITDGNRPLPMKYIVTDTGTPELLSITTFLSDWNLSPTVTDAQFTFVPPKDAAAIEFLSK